MVYTGDAFEILSTMPGESVNCIVTSPPYYALRDYGVEGQIGLEATPEEYISRLVSVFDEARRVLRGDGTLWLNLGDSYSGSGKGAATDPLNASLYKQGTNMGLLGSQILRTCGKPKNLLGIPWRVALALQERGWILRQDIIWNKPNPMPESVVDRCTKSHEYIFLFSKQQRYFFDAAAMKEPRVSDENANGFRGGSYVHDSPSKRKTVGNIRYGGQKYTENPDVFFRTKSGNLYDKNYLLRNRRSVWTVATVPFKGGAHFATFPPELIRPCVLAGCPVNGTVLDPFFGSGTVGVVCREENRYYVGIEINPEYVRIARRRIAATEGKGKLRMDVDGGAIDE